MPRCPKCKAINDITTVRCKRCGEILNLQATTAAHQSKSANGDEPSGIDIGAHWNKENDEVVEIESGSEAVRNGSDRSGQVTTLGVGSVWEDSSDIQTGENAFDQLVSDVPGDSIPLPAGSGPVENQRRDILNAQWR